MKLQISSLVLLSAAFPSESRKLGELRKLKKNPRQKQLKHKHVKAESRIVGGTQATPGDYPYFVHWDGCGASLIHEDIILSAAHCSTIDSNSVLIGAYKSGSEDYDAEYRTIEDRRSHPNYNDYTVENDFMVMKLSQASTKAPVLINSDSFSPYDNEGLIVMGFGATSEGDYYGSDFLREVTVNAVPHDTCNAQYNGEIVEDVMLCAGVPNGGKDSCQGDSGGPIVDSSGVQVGVVSWGYGCGRPEFSGVYARISGAIDWINEQVCELSDNPPESCGSGNNGGDNSSNDEGVPVEIELRLDDYPGESGFFIKSDTNEVLANYPAGSFSEYNGIIRETVDLAPGKDYQLVITDSYGDGLCCGTEGAGNYAVYAYVPDEVVLVRGEANFGENMVVDFSVPSTDTSGACENTSATFLVDSEVGDAGCGWLQTNLERYGYLCQFLDVAAACPQTCDSCEYFE